VCVFDASKLKVEEFSVVLEIPNLFEKTLVKIIVFLRKYLA